MTLNSCKLPVTVPWQIICVPLSQCHWGPSHWFCVPPLGWGWLAQHLKLVCFDWLGSWCDEMQEAAIRETTLQAMNQWLLAILSVWFVGIESMKNHFARCWPGTIPSTCFLDPPPFLSLSIQYYSGAMYSLPIKILPLYVACGHGMPENNTGSAAQLTVTGYFPVPKPTITGDQVKYPANTLRVHGVHRHKVITMSPAMKNWVHLKCIQ